MTPSLGRWPTKAQKARFPQPLGETDPVVAKPLDPVSPYLASLASSQEIGRYLLEKIPGGWVFSRIYWP